MTDLRNKNGVAMVVTLVFLVSLMSLSGIITTRAIQEVRDAQKERDTAGAFYTGAGGAQAALKQLDTLINHDLKNTIRNAKPSGVISFASQKVHNGDGIGWLVNSVRQSNNPVLAQDGDEAQYAQNGTIGGHGFQYGVTFTEKSDPVSVGLNAWDFPYNYTITSVGTVNGITGTVVIRGDFTVRVQKENFAKFSLFTNTQSLPNGTSVWFTDKTNFAGPVHTNSRFNFALNPSGTFESLISQQEHTARFYNNGSPVLLAADANGTRDVPVFNDVFTRDSAAISLNLSTQESDMSDEARGGNNYNNNGIYLPNNGASLTGGIYVKGSSSVVLSENNNNPVYTITQGATSKRVTVDYTNNQTTFEDLGTGASATYAGIPDGQDDAGTLIYVNGSISSLRGTVQADTALTVASTDDIVITNNLKYSNYTPGSGTPGTGNYVPPTAAGTDNLLGLVSWDGNVRVGTSAPDDVEIHGTVLAPNGIFQVDDYDAGSPRGTATLLGGVITDNYGAFGQFNGSTGQPVSGYGRNFVYDDRMDGGTAPPYFPTLNTFIAFTNDLTDKMIWQEGE